MYAFTSFTLSTPSGHFSQDTTLSLSEFALKLKEAIERKDKLLLIPAYGGDTLIDPSLVFFARTKEYPVEVRPTTSL